MSDDHTEAESIGDGHPGQAPDASTIPTSWVILAHGVFRNRTHIARVEAGEALAVLVLTAVGDRKGEAWPG